jgi:RNA polymerase primary sigma factor
MEHENHHLPDDEAIPSLEDLSPSETDIAAMEREVSKKELKFKRLKKGIKKYLDIDDVQHVFDTISKHPMLDREDETETARAAAAGNALAREKLILANQRLVVSIAKRYRNLGMEFAELISEGNVGLMKAVDKYDVERGWKFVTFATWWVRQAISRALADKGRAIRIPVHIVNLLYNMRKIEERYVSKTGDEPTKKELAEELGVPEEEIVFLKHARKRPGSLNVTVGHKDDDELSSMVEDGDTKHVDADMHSQDVRRLVAEALGTVKKLKDQDIRAFMVMHGLEDGHHHDMKRTAEIVGRTFQKVKDSILIVRRALKKFPSLAALLDGGDRAKE